MTPQQPQPLNDSCCIDIYRGRPDDIIILLTPGNLTVHNSCHFMLAKSNSNIYLIPPYYATSLTLQLHPESASNNGKLAPKHQPNSFPLIFFAILTSLSIGNSYPVCNKLNIKFKSRHHSGRSSNSTIAFLSNVDSHVLLPLQTLCVRSWSSRMVKLSGMPRSLVRS